MNPFLNEMLGRQRHEELIRSAEERRRVPSGPAWRPLGDLVIRFGRGLERTGERVRAASAHSHTAGDAR